MERRVVAAEPVPVNARRLLQNLRLNGVEKCVDVLQAAFSGTCGHMTMTLRENFSEGAETGNAAALIDDGTDEIWRRVEVSTRTLDELLDDLLLGPRKRAAEVGDLMRRAVGEGR